MGLTTYRRKRDFRKTPEPTGETGTRPRRRRLLFVIQKHAASRLHYDFRLEVEGVLKSWAVPKGPSLDPKDKRLAVRVEDHPIEYGSFEGIIPQGEYGGITVLLWDRGEWIPEGDPSEGLRRGRLTFRLEGEKLRGLWTLVRLRGSEGEGKTNWLLFKNSDDEARSGGGGGIVTERPESVATGRDLEQIAREADSVWGPKGMVTEPNARKSRSKATVSDRAPHKIAVPASWQKRPPPPRAHPAPKAAPVRIRRKA